MVRQWRLIAAVIPGLDLDAPSRISGWRNREVVAHLTVQPGLLVHFLASASTDDPTMTLAANLTGTHTRADFIDAAVREASDQGKLNFAAAVDGALARLRAADLRATIVTLQGPIVLADYLVTRCVEAVVHGGDLVPPVEPDPTAQAIVADALLAALVNGAPDLVDEARAMPRALWIDVATGRETCDGPLAGVVPVMS